MLPELSTATPEGLLKCAAAPVPSSLPRPPMSPASNSSPNGGSIAPSPPPASASPGNFGNPHEATVNAMRQAPSHALRILVIIVASWKGNLGRGVASKLPRESQTGHRRHNMH